MAGNVRGVVAPYTREQAMAAFDALPVELRELLRDASCSFSSVEVARLHDRGIGAGEIAYMIERQAAAAMVRDFGLRHPQVRDRVAVRLT